MGIFRILFLFISISILYSADFLDHNTGKNHPENPDRIRTCKLALENCTFNNKLNWIEPKILALKFIQIFENCQNN